MSYKFPSAKKCCRCTEYKPIEDFIIRKPNEARTWRVLWCAPCREKPRRINVDEATGFTYKDKRAFIQSLKAKPCHDCGQQFHFSAMDFDHVRGDKQFNLAAPAGWVYDEILAEVAKCDVVCSNCHRVRTFNRSKSARDGVAFSGPIKIDLTVPNG